MIRASKSLKTSSRDDGKKPPRNVALSTSNKTQNNVEAKSMLGTIHQLVGLLLSSNFIGSLACLFCDILGLLFLIYVCMVLL